MGRRLLRRCIHDVLPGFMHGRQGAAMPGPLRSARKFSVIFWKISSARFKADIAWLSHYADKIRSR